MSRKHAFTRKSPQLEPLEARLCLSSLPSPTNHEPSDDVAHAHLSAAHGQLATSFDLDRGHTDSRPQSLAHGDSHGHHSLSSEAVSTLRPRNTSIALGSRQRGAKLGLTSSATRTFPMVSQAIDHRILIQEHHNKGKGHRQRVQDYIALGDSIAFGETDVIPQSKGDQGYVSLFADWLATQHHGVRPQVINLAIPGETSATFFDASAPGIAPHQLAASFNLNYIDPSVSQEQLLLSTISAEKMAHHRITHVSFALGINDFNYLLTVSHPEFFSLPSDQQQLLIGQTFATIQTNYVTALTEIHRELPRAKVVLLDYFNALGFLGSNDPINQFEIPLFQSFQTMVQAEARDFRATFVDIYKPFVGHELDYTFEPTGSHPNAHGYQVISQQMISASEER
jgi:lysophospholipase L1-like esterase